MGLCVESAIPILFVALAFPCVVRTFHLVASSAPPPRIAEPSFLECLQDGGVQNFTTLSSDAPTFYHLLNFSIQNLRFSNLGVPVLSVLVLPESPHQVQTAVNCTIKSGLLLRIRSGGHDYEGLSYTAQSPFVVIDLMNLQSLEVDLDSKTAWAQAGITLGQLYYGISQVTSDYGFPAGVCPTVCAGGHISGGGYGFMSRKHGIAADNVIDALLVDANGELLNRESMGEDYFWALRGGGGGSWGVVVAWRLRLVPVAPRVTAFNVLRTNRTLLKELIYKWQTVAPFEAPEDMQIVVYLMGGATVSGNLAGLFYGYYMAGMNETVELMKKIYPELGLTADDCDEGTWIEAVANVGRAGSPLGLTDRLNTGKNYFKAKSDYVRAPILKEAWDGVFDLLEANPSLGSLLLEPYQGVMARIPADETPFPHREGNWYVIQYHADWDNNTGRLDETLLAWSQTLHAYMAPYVSQDPRQAYVGYIDLDTGASSSFAEAFATWGRSYFGDNFLRLAEIKTRVDPNNIFRHPQSIPLLHNYSAIALPFVRLTLA